MKKLTWLSRFLALVLTLGVFTQTLVLPLTAAPLAASASSFDAAKLAEMDKAVEQAIADKKCPGGVLWVEHNGTIYKKAYGNRAVEPAVEATTEDTIYDAASLTKVCAATPAMMLLIERGLVKLDDAVTNYIPEFGQNGKEGVTVRHLMTHTSGLKSGIRVDDSWKGTDGAIQKISATKLDSTPGTVIVYSDINFVTVAEIVQRVTKQKLNEFLEKEVYGPLKMTDTGFLPPADKVSRIAPTQPDGKGKMLRGVVHDPTARNMGGVSGNAGLFSTASDLARFARMILNEGELDGVRVFKPETIRLMRTVATGPNVNGRRALGWDVDTPYSGPRGKVLPLGSFGHTGWTGTSLWMDPFSKTTVIFMSNRNHPDGKGNVIGLRSQLGTLAAQAITDFNFSDVKGALSPVPYRKDRKQVLNGIDVLVREHFIRLRGLKIGLVTNHTGQDRDRNPTIDMLFNAPGVQLKCLLSPEHGIRGAQDDKVKDGVDEKTGLPVYSLYGGAPKRLKDQSDADYEMAAIRAFSPKPEHMKDIDVLLFDIQDVGARFYTYSSTLGGVIESAGKAGKKVMVLDRVNPVTGLHVEGPVLTRHYSFIAFHKVPVRHGMTLGELAKMYNAERNFGCDLTVVPVENWTRDMWYDETSLPWLNPSPNMRSLPAATLYAGLCLLERNPVSLGRGTEKPFEVVGAAYIDDQRFAWEMNQVGLPGVSFIPIRFKPNTNYFNAAGFPFKNVECGGVYVNITDRNLVNAVDVGVTMLQVLHRLYPKEFQLEKCERMIGHAATVDAIKAGKTLAEIHEMWAPDYNEFLKRREAFLIYK